MKRKKWIWIWVFAVLWAGLPAAAPAVYMTEASEGTGDLTEASLQAAAADPAEEEALPATDARITDHGDGTVTLTVTVDGALSSFDYGVAYSPMEAELLSYQFTDAFFASYGENMGSGMTHSFEEGVRVSENARYVVFGGMAKKGTAYQGDFFTLTFRLKQGAATVALVRDSASFDNAEQILTQGTAYRLETALVSAPAETPGKDAGEDAGEDAGKDTGEDAGQEQEPSRETAKTPETQKEDQLQNSAAVGRDQTRDGEDAAQGNQADRPKTGDDGNPEGWMLLFAGAFLMILLNIRSNNAIMNGENRIP